MKRILLSIAAVAAFAQGAPAQQANGRPVILLVHGRGMQDRDSVAVRKQWLGALRSGVSTLTREPILEDGDVRVVWYADALDPRSSAGCDYAADDLRAKRGAMMDADFKQFATLVGNFFGAITSLAGAGEDVAQLRALSADAAFLSDARKRCASEARLGAAIDGARRQGRPIIVVAHSLGAVMAYDHLSARSDSGVVSELVTIGSMAGASAIRSLLIGEDSSSTFGVPRSVAEWTNIRHVGDDLATPLTVGHDLLTSPPADEPDPHEMAGYLRGTTTARAVVGAWCQAVAPTIRPRGCNDVITR